MNDDDPGIWEEYHDDLGDAADIGGFFQRNRQLKEQQRTRELLERQEAREQARESLPKCPACASPLVDRVRVCAACRREIIWFYDLPAEKTRKGKMRESLVARKTKIEKGLDDVFAKQSAMKAKRKELQEEVRLTAYKYGIVKEKKVRNPETIGRLPLIGLGLLLIAGTLLLMLIDSWPIESTVSRSVMSVFICVFFIAGAFCVRNGWRELKFVRDAGKLPAAIRDVTSQLSQLQRQERSFSSELELTLRRLWTE